MTVGKSKNLWNQEEEDDKRRERHSVNSIVVRRHILTNLPCLSDLDSLDKTRHDNIDFRPIITKTSDILPLSVVTADKAYDSEENHVLVRELLHGFSIIPTRYEYVPI